jgi:hypothetical protein
MNDNGFLLTTAFRPLGKDRVSAIEAAQPVDIDGAVVRLASRPPLLVLTAEPFATEQAALDFLPRIRIALWTMLVRSHIAYRAHLEPLEVTYAEDPLIAGKNLAKSFGLPEEPVHGLVEADSVAVLPRGKTIRFLELGDVTVSVSTPASVALESLSLGLMNPQCTELAGDERLATALELYNEYFYETSARAKFLTLAMILEVLAPMTEKHSAVQALVARWKAEMATIRAATTDADALSALESLDRELDFRRETSIRQRVRALANESFRDLDTGYAARLEREAVAAYDARGALVHAGTMPAAQLNAAHEQAQRVVRAILSLRLRIPGAPL